MPERSGRDLGRGRGARASRRHRKTWSKTAWSAVSARAATLKNRD